MGQFSKLGRCARILFACVPAVLAMAGPWSSAMAEDPNAPVPGGVSSAAAVKPPVARQIEPMVPPIRRVQPKNPPLTVSVPQPAAKQAEKSATSPTATPTATPAPIVASPPVASQRQSANAAPGSAPTVEKATKNVAAARAVAVKYVVHTCRVGQDYSDKLQACFTPGATVAKAPKTVKSARTATAGSGAVDTSLRSSLGAKPAR